MLVSKRGKSRPTLGAWHASDTSLWFARGDIIDDFAPDALIHFVNVRDPNVENENKTPSWPRWGTPGSSSILIFEDSDTRNIIQDNFRAQPIDTLNRVLLHLPLTI
ncbi:hypothetical protein HGRIS_009000 [Hohenbuehelia grisea]|uniref:Uncharacterized protein n=1 Tax=Hohenbuehelia grisea TaxID=104357 RepID=A0ABR3IZY5_9AGAR